MKSTIRLPEQIKQDLKLPFKALALGNELHKHANKYAPFREGILIKMSRVENKEPLKVSLVYYAPYAHYVYEGLLYLASNGSAWAKKGEKKIKTNMKLNYGNGRMSHWIKHAYEINKNQLLKIFKD